MAQLPRTYEDLLTLWEPLSKEQLLDLALGQAKRIKELEDQIDNMTMTIHAATPDGVVEVGRVKVTIHEGD